MYHKDVLDNGVVIVGEEMPCSSQKRLSVSSGQPG
jgi:hypothetical protein